MHLVGFIIKTYPRGAVVLVNKSIVLCLAAYISSIIALRIWLHFVAETCRSKKLTIVHLVGNKLVCLRWLHREYIIILEQYNIF